ncbi:MAG: DUF484 family protein, partial [Betaproteobacteria bacterium]|nr:DUF484 family protein [Betaproteobacteria bacterium]
SHSALLVDINLPHPHGTHAVSLSERQLQALREKNRALESRMNELISYAGSNDNTSSKVHRLAVSLIGARSLSSVLDITQRQLNDDFAVPQCAIRLWGIAQENGRIEFSPVQSELREFVSHMETPHCGHHAVYETSRWFESAAPSLRSFAMMPLRDKDTFGVLLLASPDENRFYPDMGTFYLNRIADLLSAALRAQTHASDPAP